MYLLTLDYLTVLNVFNIFCCYLCGDPVVKNYAKSFQVNARFPPVSFE